MNENQENKLDFFTDGMNTFGFLFGSILCLIVFSYVFIGLFTFETPVTSAVFGIFLGMFATCLASPFCAGIGFLLGGMVSGLLTWYKFRAAPN
ncbi:hypothetical protein [Neisseria chenwenguii]|uniref:hypothetical protein n=1 Tax=Neisseria chenwenguii TaxID=1853278 RepID=UPI000F4DE9FB|nr:hypothetical protein [Neisseria chenwenguii]ROV57146.1 hypothetical protein EGS38_00145 [Neisseria chenwenguii]